MSIQLFNINDATDERREFALMLVDATDGITPAAGEANENPQIRKPGETSWTNTDATLIHIGNGHYIVVLIPAEIDTAGNFSVRHQSGTCAEFQEVGHVQAITEISLDEINQKIDKNRSILKEIQWNVNRVEKRTQPDPFVNPL